MKFDFLNTWRLGYLSTGFVLGWDDGITLIIIVLGFGFILEIG